MNAKIYNGNVQPNHKEYKIWVNDEGIIKTWNGTEWIELSGASSGGSGSGDDYASNLKYYEILLPQDQIEQNLMFYMTNFKVVYNNNVEYTNTYLMDNYPSVDAVTFKAFMFSPIVMTRYDGKNTTILNLNELVEQGMLNEITAEEYWAEFNAE